MEIDYFKLNGTELEIGVFKNSSIEKAALFNKKSESFDLKIVEKTDTRTIFSLENVPDYGMYGLKVQVNGQLVNLANNELNVQFESEQWKLSKDEKFFIQSMTPSISKKTRDIVIIGYEPKGNGKVSFTLPKKAVEALTDFEIVLRNQKSDALYLSVPATLRENQIEVDFSKVQSELGDKWFVFLKSDNIRYRLYNPINLAKQVVLDKLDDVENVIYFTKNKRVAYQTVEATIDFSQYLYLTVNEAILTDNEVQFALPEEISTSMERAYLMDEQRLITEFTEVPQYFIRDNVLHISIKTLPQAGRLAILIEDNSKNIFVLTNTSGFEEQENRAWKVITSNDYLLITPVSNRDVRPTRRQLIVRNYEVLTDKVKLIIPNIALDDVIATNESENKIFPLSWQQDGTQLLIDFSDFDAALGWYYKIFLLSDGIKFRAFVPNEVFKNDAQRHQEISENLYSSFTREGYLKIASLNDQQKEKMIMNSSLRVTDISEDEGNLLLDSSNAELTANQSMVITRLSNSFGLRTNIVDSGYEISTNNLNHEQFAIGIPYKVMLATQLENDSMIYAPVVTKKLVNVDNKRVLVESAVTIAKNAEESFELITDKALNGFIRLAPDNFDLYENTSKIVQRIYFEYKERSVYHSVEFDNISENITRVKFNWSSAEKQFKNLIIIYQQDGQLYRTVLALDKLSVVE